MLPRISITSEMGWLSLRSQRSNFQVGRETTELRMQNEFAAVEMDITHPRVRIDQTEAFATSGLKTCQKQAMDYFKQCEAEGKRVAGTIAQEGKEFVQIEKRGKPIQSQARRLWAKDPQLTVVSMPSVRPRISLDPGTVRTAFKPGSPNARFRPVEDPGVYEAAQVHGSWLQEPYIVIDVVPPRISGAIVDTIV